jgi:hypothetical protein
MWFLVAFAGLAAAAWSVDSEGAEGGLLFAADDDEGQDQAGTGASAGGDDATKPDDDDATDDDDASDADDDARDPWLDGDPFQDEFISTDEAADDGTDTGGHDAPPAPPPNDDIAARDPWLDGWTDDAYLSTDDPTIIA